MAGVDRQHFQYPSPSLYEAGEKGPGGGGGGGGGYHEVTREVRPQHRALSSIITSTLSFISA